MKQYVAKWAFYLQFYRNITLPLKNYESKNSTKILDKWHIIQKILPVNIVLHFGQVGMFDLNFASSDFFLPNA